jgi:hypothetical protein
MNVPALRIHSKASKPLRILFWIAIEAVATLVVLEVGLRVVRPYHRGLNSLLYVPSVNTDFSRIRSTEKLLSITPLGYSPGRTVRGFVLNSSGFRTHEYSCSRQPGFRVVALGDSFTYGAVPYRQTWPVQLESQLRTRQGRQDGVEVISLGVPGVGPQFTLRMWELEGKRLQPDVVVLGFFVGNDLIEEGGRQLHDNDSGFLVEHSLTVRAFRNAWRLLGGGMAGRDPRPGAGAKGGALEPAAFGVEVKGWSKTIDPLRPTLQETAYGKVEWQRMAICLRSNRHLTVQRVNVVGPILEELDRSVRAAGARLLVLLIPDEFQVEDDLSSTLLEMHGVASGEYVRALPQKLLTAYLESRGISFIDVLPKFRTTAASKRLYLVRDSHWNAAGNRLAARMIVRYIEGWLPPPSSPLFSGIGNDPRVVGDAIAVRGQSRGEIFDEVGRDVVQDALGQVPGFDEDLEVGDGQAAVREVLAPTARKQRVEAFDISRKPTLDELFARLFHGVALQPERAA